MSQTHEALARRWFDEVWNQRKIAAIPKMLSPDSLCHTEQGSLVGAEAFLKRVHEPFIGAFPNLQIVVEGIITAEDQVLVRWIAYGTHSGSGLGMPPTHRHVTFPGLTWMRIAGEHIIEARDCWSVGGLLLALRGGPIPPSVTIKETPLSLKSGESICD